jgi:hypothetical protein
MTQPERTSAQVAKLAGRFLELPIPGSVMIFLGFRKGKAIYVDWRDVRKLAASALTQVENSKKGRGK